MRRSATLCWAESAAFLSNVPRLRSCPLSSGAVDALRLADLAIVSGPHGPSLGQSPWAMFPLAVPSDARIPRHGARTRLRGGRQGRQRFASRRSPRFLIGVHRRQRACMLCRTRGMRAFARRRGQAHAPSTRARPHLSPDVRLDHRAPGPCAARPSFRARLQPLRHCRNRGFTGLARTFAPTAPKRQRRRRRRQRARGSAARGFLRTR